MNTIVATLTWPFRTAFNFIDARPSGAQIRKHLASTVPVVVENDDGLVVGLKLIGTDKVLPGGKVTRTRDELESCSSTVAFGSGIAVGYELAVGEAANLTRSKYAECKRTVRELERAEEEVERAERAAEHDGGGLIHKPA